jgi:RHS repeat-associated protein
VFQDLRMQYDAHGNVTHRSKGWHTEQEFSYGPEHQLRQATVQRRTDRQDSQRSVSQTTHYRYDALGRRVSKTDAFGSTYFAYDGDLLATEQRGSKTAEFLYEDDSFVPLARIDGTAGALDFEIQYYHCDQIGAPQELSDEQGRIVWAASYKVWGEVQPVKALATGTDGGATQLGARTALRSVSTATGGRQGGSLGLVEQPLRFQGQYFDAETGLHYNRFRYYDPVVGRFTSQDPIGLLGGFLLESFAPSATTWSDPLGLAGKGQIGTYGSLTGRGNTGDEFEAHELIRNEALEQMGCGARTKRGTPKRHPDNPSIALDLPTHDQVHVLENDLARTRFGLGVNQFQFGQDGLPSKQQMDVWQGAVRKSGMGASQARRLRKRSNSFLKRICCC